MADINSAENLSDKDILVDQLISNGSTKWKQVGIIVAGDKKEAEGEGVDQLNTPNNLAFDNKYQSLYVSDYTNGRIQRFSVNGKDDRTGVTVLKLNDLDVPPELALGKKGNNPNALFIDKNDNIYVSEHQPPCRVLKLSPNGTLTTVIESGDSTFRCCSGLYVDENGNIYVADWEESTVWKFDKNGKKREIVAGGNGYGNQSDQLSHPKGIFVAEKTGNIYVVDVYNRRVQRWSPSSKVGETVCGGNDEGDDLNQFEYPWSVFVDGNEKQIYVCDPYNGRVVRWSAGAEQGEFIVGNNSKNANPTELPFFAAIKFDQNGNMYVADSKKNQIRKYLIDN
ncbi:unnamed protein product [Adineta steineri]|uniref:Uncharacterized protein n=1 Tax=Adineta steineri TaxID=433720 RepID=A0A814SVU0_9BILA|nr:unnamed protein product [Adineta steineri]CAF0847348.1 unnamed protein product [Adineta steineri]CAF1153501.1 unnamed protein product [Adineta steineri]